LLSNRRRKRNILREAYFALPTFKGMARKNECQWLQMHEICQVAPFGRLYEYAYKSGLGIENLDQSLISILCSQTCFLSAMNSYSCSDCNAEVTAAQLRGFEAVRCSWLCRHTFHTACVDLPEDAIRLLTNMPKLLCQCDGCAVSNE